MSKLLLALCCVAWLAGCANDGDGLVAQNVRVPLPPPGRGMTAAYFTLVNHADRPVTVTRVSSPQFGIVEMHESTIDGGVARMRPLIEITIPARSSVPFAPGGKHVMLMQPVENGDDITLNFYSGDTMILTVTTNYGS